MCRADFSSQVCILIAELLNQTTSRKPSAADKQSGRRTCPPHLCKNLISKGQGKRKKDNTTTMRPLQAPSAVAPNNEVYKINP